MSFGQVNKTHQRRIHETCFAIFSNTPKRTRSSKSAFIGCLTISNGGFDEHVMMNCTATFPVFNEKPGETPVSCTGSGLLPNT